MRAGVKASRLWGATFLALTASLPANVLCQIPAMPASSPSYAKTVGGTLGGGLVGGAALGLAGALLSEAVFEDDIVPAYAPGLIIGASVGYWLGQAWGASWGSATTEHRLPTSSYLMPAALWTGAGLGIYALIGDAFDPEEGEATDYTSWYIGAVVGGLVQVVGMSTTAHRMAVREAGLVSMPVGLHVRRGPERRLIADAYVRLAW